MKYKIKKAIEAYKFLSDENGSMLDVDGEMADGIKVVDAAISKSKEEVIAAAANGTRVHEMLEEHVSRGGLLDNSPEAIGFKNWQKKFKPEFIETEQILFHPELLYAGTCDLICKIKGETWIIDYKTSNKLYNKNGLQLTSYAMAKEEISDMQIDKIGCLQLGKNKQGYYFKEYKRDDDIFTGLVKLFSWSNPNFIKNQQKALNSTYAGHKDLINHKIKI